MLIINIYLSSFFTLKIVCFLYSEHGWLHSYKLYMMMIKKRKKKVKIYQVHLPPTTQFIHGLIFGYDILVFLKVGCTFLSLKRKVFNLHESFCTFWKAYNFSIPKSIFLFLYYNFFLIYMPKCVNFRLFYANN